MESVSLTISEMTLAQFSLTVSKSTGLGALTNPPVTFESFSLTTSQSAPTQFLLTISELTGV
jgi:hypothetical protein